MKALGSHTPPLPSHYDDYLDLLGCALHAHCEQAFDAQILNEAISLHRRALEIRSFGNSSRSASLANALLTCFENTGKVLDSNEAISLHQEALELLFPEHPDRTCH